MSRGQERDALVRLVRWLHELASNFQVAEWMPDDLRATLDRALSEES